MLRSATPLSMPGAPDLQHVLARLHEHAVAPGQVCSGSGSGRTRASGSAQLAGVHDDRPALVLDPGTAGRARRAATGSPPPARRSPGVGRDHELVGGGVPALHAVLAEHHHRLQPRPPAEPAEADGGPRRPAGDDGDGPQQRPEPGQRRDRGRVRVGVLGVVDDRGQRAVEVEPDQRLARGGPSPLAWRDAASETGPVGSWRSLSDGCRCRQVDGPGPARYRRPNRARVSRDA